MIIRCPITTFELLKEIFRTTYYPFNFFCVLPSRSSLTDSPTVQNFHWCAKVQVGSVQHYNVTVSHIQFLLEKVPFPFVYLWLQIKKRSALASLVSFCVKRALKREKVCKH